MRLLIDFDSPIYAACNIAMGKYYTVASERFQYKSEATAYCTEFGIPLEDIEPAFDQQPLENVLYLLKTQIQDILDTCPHDDYQIYLSGSSNFRYEVYDLYKANRPKEKPTHFQEARQYVIDVWGAEVVDGMEADDKVVIEQSKALRSDLQESATTICHIDKDIDQMPGWHYNFKKKERYWVTEEEARLNYWTQVLTGDTGDNIPGLAGIGVKTAHKLLKDCETDLDYYETCKKVWLDKVDKPANEVLSELYTSCELLYLKRSDNDTWTDFITKVQAEDSSRESDCANGEST